LEDSDGAPVRNRAWFGLRPATVRVVDRKPGMECQLYFSRLGVMPDVNTSRCRAVSGLSFTAVFRRTYFVWLQFAQTLADVIAGCEAVWRFYGSGPSVLIPDNLKPVVANDRTINPALTSAQRLRTGPAGSAPTRRESVRRTTKRRPERRRQPRPGRPSASTRLLDGPCR
jgi:hypothetical protein